MIGLDWWGDQGQKIKGKAKVERWRLGMLALLAACRMDMTREGK